ncbi:Putative transposase (identified by ISEscan HMM) [Escherichia coli]|nr:Putative transposase (identified by ISEscan HMM) [Escherichia coli]
MINKIDFKAKNLTSNAGLFLFLENAKAMGF